MYAPDCRIFIYTEQKQEDSWLHFMNIADDVD